jgi:hypothetical protein
MVRRTQAPRNRYCWHWTQHHGPHNAQQRIARLMREALAAWTHAVTKTARAADR